MLQEDKLDALLQLLKDMTDPTSRDTPPASRRIAPGFQTALAFGFFAGTIVLICIGAWYWIRSSKPPHVVSYAALLLYVVSMLMACIYLVFVTIDAVRTTPWRRHEFFSATLGALQKDIRMDASFLTRLWAFDKPTLEYGLIQYRYRWNITDRRLASLAGDIRKLGLFPALTAAAISAATLYKDSSDLWLWLPLVVACAFYLMAFIAVNQRERPDQVITLLEYAIRHTSESFDPAHADAVPNKPTGEHTTLPEIASPVPA